MNFSDALNRVKSGERVARDGWNGRDMWVALYVPDENSKMRRSYLYMRLADGDIVPWVVSQSDALANDWYVVS